MHTLPPTTDDRPGLAAAVPPRAEAQLWWSRKPLRKAGVSPVHPQYRLVFGPGFHQDQGGHRWMGAEGDMRFRFEKRPREIRVQFACARAEYYRVFPFRLHIRVDGETCESVVFCESNQEGCFTFRPNASRVTVRLHSETVSVPAEIGLNDGGRPLSIRITNVEVVPGDEDFDEKTPGVLKTVESSRLPKSDPRDARRSSPPPAGDEPARQELRPSVEPPRVEPPPNKPFDSRAEGNVEHAGQVPDKPPITAASLEPTVHWTNFAQLAFSTFLAGDNAIRFSACRRPRVSILLVLYGRCELTYLCLQSLLANCRTSYEVILVDNASDDETPWLLSRIENAKIARNRQNVGFVTAVNQAARMARGQHLLLLNNDTQLVGDAVATAAQVLESDADIGAVGGRIVAPDGTLQEAGSLVRPNGSTLAYGYGQSPTEVAFMVRRNVDFCSGAFLMTRKSDFDALGGLDEDFSPGYYEELDYCTRLAKQGKRVVCEPRVLLLHYGTASSSEPHVRALMHKNRGTYYEKHRDWLERRQASPAEAPPAR